MEKKVALSHGSVKDAVIKVIRAMPVGTKFHGSVSDIYPRRRTSFADTIMHRARRHFRDMCRRVEITHSLYGRV